MEITRQKTNITSISKWLLLMLTGLLLVAWLFNTPPGLLGKADAVGYAVCHRIDTHSFHLGVRSIPLCARCSGMYLGAVLGIIYQFLQGKRCAMPSLKIGLFLGLLVGFFAVDGINSYLHFFPQAPALYQPNNWMRLLTGTGMGISISAVLVPAFNQTVWKSWDPRAGLGSWKQVALLIGLGIFMDILLAWENPLILYPLALVSAFGVLLVLGMVYTLVWLMVFRKENRFDRLIQLWVAMTAGGTTALLQVALIDLGRYWFTGTWQGFQL